LSGCIARAGLLTAGSVGIRTASSIRMTEDFEQIHDREVVERRKARIYQIALAVAVLIVAFALVMAARSILATG
jgi:hypothetical protein